MAKKLPTIFLKICLEPEIFDTKDASCKDAKKKSSHLFIWMYDACLLVGLSFFIAKNACLLNLFKFDSKIQLQ